jgi:hypothetical protein
MNAVESLVGLQNPYADSSGRRQAGTLGRSVRAGLVTAIAAAGTATPCQRRALPARS